LDWIDKMFDKKTEVNTPEGETLQVALLLIRHYEDQHFPIPIADPIETIKLKMLERWINR